VHQAVLEEGHVEGEALGQRLLRQRVPVGHGQVHAVDGEAQKAPHDLAVKIDVVERVAPSEGFGDSPNRGVLVHLGQAKLGAGLHLARGAGEPHLAGVGTGVEDPEARAPQLDAEALELEEHQGCDLGELVAATHGLGAGAHALEGLEQRQLGA
jgi:hypothetical protein